jgi:hypothetical protein
MDQTVGDALVEDDRRIRRQGSQKRPGHKRTAAE